MLLAKMEMDQREDEFKLWSFSSLCNHSRRRKSQFNGEVTAEPREAKMRKISVLFVWLWLTG